MADDSTAVPVDAPPVVEDVAADDSTTNDAPAEDAGGDITAAQHESGDSTGADDSREDGTGADDGGGGANNDGAATAAGAAVNGGPVPELQEALAASAAYAQEAPAPRREVRNGRPYEIIYIGRAGDPEGVDRAEARVRDLIEGTGGAVDNVRTSEARRLAYPIKKQLEGVYVVINARFAKEATAELDRFFKLEESVLRHMIRREEV